MAGWCQKIAARAGASRQHKRQQEKPRGVARLPGAGCGHVDLLVLDNSGRGAGNVTMLGLAAWAPAGRQHLA